MPTIALVDDDRNILTSVSIALENEGFRIETYTDGTSALEGLRSHPPDLAILDVKMPRMDGMELLRRLRERSSLPVIILTSKDGEDDEIEGLDLGADDFVRKPFSQRLLVERVKTVLKRSRSVSADAGGRQTGAEVRQTFSLERGDLKMDVERHASLWKGKPVTLTVTEFQILHSLAQRPGVVRNRTELMSIAYGEDVDVDERTVDSHVKRVRRKFRSVDQGFDAIATLYGVGYRYDP